ncbi:amino acid ABC transporter permease [Celeribacter sp.]|uniref:amino acid ABC transporter permease n=1 Tax=Celeribacter sp. TaxID=1890673 RepID=UPI003A92E3F8
MLEVVAPYAMQLLQGLSVTLKIALGSFILGLGLATVCVPLLTSRFTVLRRALGFYVAVVRGLPELLIIFLIFYGGTVLLTKLSGSYFEVNALAAGIVALAVVAFAYNLEILRSALNDIPGGQWEAATTLGLNPVQTFGRVILPQLMRRALPGLGNQWLITLKESALVSIIGLEELMRKSVVAEVQRTNH